MKDIWCIYIVITKNIDEKHQALMQGVDTEDRFEKKGMAPIICEKGFRGHPLTEEQKHNNCKKSKVRCRVEHVFGFMEHSMGDFVFRSVGIVRASAVVAMTNLIYNIARPARIFKYHRDLITL